MKRNLTEIIFIIDRSGSMYGLSDDTIGGFNGFLEKQKEVEGDAILTVVLFNDTHMKLYDRTDLREVVPMTREQYAVGGGTALLDALGDTITETQKRHDKMPLDERPEHILCVITTDGYENSSTKYKKSQVREMIDHQREGHGWEFIFLGANMDAVKEAQSYGITNSATYIADSIGTKTVYDAVNIATSSLRACGTIDSAWYSEIEEYTKANQ